MISQFHGPGKQLNIDVHPEVIGLSGGQKNKWLTDHRQEVLGFYSENGQESTKMRFKMSKETLTSFLIKPEPEYDKFSKVDRALTISQTAIDSARETQRQLEYIRLQLAEIQPGLRLLYNFGEMLRDLMALSGDTRVKSDSLSLADFDEKSSKQRLR